MRPQRSSAKPVDYAVFDASPAPAHRKRSRVEEEEVSVSISPSPVRSKSKDNKHKRGTPKSKKDNKKVEKMKSLEVVDNKGKKKDVVVKESNKENTDIQPKQKKSKKDQKKDSEVAPLSESSQSSQPSQSQSSQSSKSSKTSKSSKSSQSSQSSQSSKASSSSSSSPSSSSSSQASRPSKPKPFPVQSKEESENEQDEYVPLAQQKRALQDPIVAISNIIGDEIKSASSKICTLESDMISARNAKEFVKSQDHRYDSLRTKFEELKVIKKALPAPAESNTDEELRALVARMREDMKELSHDQTVVRKKLKEQRKEIESARKVIEEEKKTLEVERRRVEEEGREINIEKRRIERGELEKEREDAKREKWVLSEERKELEEQKRRAKREAEELSKWRENLTAENTHTEREKRRLADEHAREQRRFEEWAREIGIEKKNMEEQKGYWAYEKRDIERKQEEVVATLRSQFEREKREVDKHKNENKQLADELNAASHRWAEHQEEMKNKIQAMVQHINTSTSETDTAMFLRMMSGLDVTKITENKFQCECSNRNKQSRLKFEMTIREDVEYNPLEIVGAGMLPECVKESVFFMKEDLPIFLCKIISSMSR